MLNTRRNLSLRTVQFIALIALTVSLATSGIGCKLFDDAVREESFDVVETVTRLVVDSASGDVVVTAAETEVITVDLVIHGSDTVVDQRQSGSELTLETNCEDQWANCSVDYTITVPPRMDVVLTSGSGDVSVVGTIGTARLDTGSGNVEVHCIRGDSVEADTGSGDIFCSELEVDQVDAETGSGDIHGTSLSVARMTAETGSGDVELKFSLSPDSLDIDTGSGDIELEVPSEEYSIHTDTGSGDVDIDGVTIMQGSPHDIDLRTGSGDITVSGH